MPPSKLAVSEAGMRRKNFTGLAGVVGAAVWMAAACGSGDQPGAPATSSDDASTDLDASPSGDAVYERAPYDGARPPAGPRTPVHAEVVTTRVDVQQLLFAGGEMQISGEPFAQNFAGRNLADYDRNYIPPDQYIVDNGLSNPTPVTDLFGFSTAVESYEYSKYYMNMEIQETTAGVSLANGPVTAALQGATAFDRLVALANDLLTNAGTDIGGYAKLPAPVGNNQNYLGFPGLWPQFLPFRSWDPALTPTLTVVASCTYQGGYGGLGVGTTIDPLYECAYNTTHLPNREQQVEKVLVPAVLGLGAWKQALWAIDFAGRIHDTGNNPVNAVAPSDVGTVGQRGNQVVGTDPPTAAPGTYIGSSPLEGMWGLVMLSAMDNAAEWLVSSATTTNGVALGAFPTKKDALAYDYGSPPVWFPAAMNVVEDQTIPYPAVTSVSVGDATSRSEDLSALLLGNAMFFGMTDPRNAGVGQRVGLRASFDGDPFPADDGVADGEDTAHDRALAVLRVAFIDLDRMHADPTLGVFADTATVSGGAITRSPTVTTSSLAHAVIALRQTLLSLNGSITQYGAPDPDPLADLKGILNPLPFHPPATGGTVPVFSQRVRQVFVTNATFVRDVLARADGTVSNSATIASGQATPSTDATTLESQTAAARALTEAFLLTGDESFRARARAVITRLATDFYSDPARMYRQQAAGPDQVHMTPERFAWLQSALRETYKALSVPGDPVLDRSVLEDRIARVNKLYLNGWDDLNGDQVVDQPGECLSGRLQMAEQALTGELGRDDLGRPVPDRDSDCVIEMAHAKTASVQASDVFFHSP
ncbi:MAG TPA: hypothetical protein VIF09_14220 [Polyangiaceae bacterium]|jgi:hypothetical protein